MGLRRPEASDPVRPHGSESPGTLDILLFLLLKILVGAAPARLRGGHNCCPRPGTEAATGSACCSRVASSDSDIGPPGRGRDRRTDRAARIWQAGSERPWRGMGPARARPRPCHGPAEGRRAAGCRAEGARPGDGPRRAFQIPARPDGCNSGRTQALPLVTTDLNAVLDALRSMRAGSTTINDGPHAGSAPSKDEGSAQRTAPRMRAGSTTSNDGPHAGSAPSNDEGSAQRAGVASTEWAALRAKPARSAATVNVRTQGAIEVLVYSCDKKNSCETSAKFQGEDGRTRLPSAGAPRRAAQWRARAAEIAQAPLFTKAVSLNASCAASPRLARSAVAPCLHRTDLGRFLKALAPDGVARLARTLEPGAQYVQERQGHDGRGRALPGFLARIPMLLASLRTVDILAACRRDGATKEPSAPCPAISLVRVQMLVASRRVQTTGIAVRGLYVSSQAFHTFICDISKLSALLKLLGSVY